jgi:hypothetical protein
MWPLSRWMLTKQACDVIMHVRLKNTSNRRLSKLPSLGDGEARQPTIECVWYCICQCVNQVGSERQQRKKERELTELPSEVQFPAFAPKRLDPNFIHFSINLVTVLSLILCSVGGFSVLFCAFLRTYMLVHCCKSNVKFELSFQFVCMNSHGSLMWHLLPPLGFIHSGVQLARLNCLL